MRQSVSPQMIKGHGRTIRAFKAELVRQISIIVQQRRFIEAETAQVLGLDQPKVSALLRGQLRGFSLERLTRFLNALDAT